MENPVIFPAEVDHTAREMFYHLIGQAPESETAWAERQATLRSWRSDPRFEPYWPSIDHMLEDDFASFRRRVAAMKAFVPLEDYDLKHAHDHLL